MRIRVDEHVRSQRDVRELWNCSVFGCAATGRPATVAWDDLPTDCRDRPHVVLWADVDLSTYQRSTYFPRVTVEQREL